MILVLRYGELAQRAARRAGALRDRYAILSGARVAIIAKNCPSYVETMYAVWLAGAAVVPVNAKLHPSEFSYILEHAGADLAFASADLADQVAAHGDLKLVVLDSPEFDRMLAADPIAAVPRDAGDLAWLFYTSGATPAGRRVRISPIGTLRPRHTPTWPRSIRPRRAMFCFTLRR